MKTPLSIRLLYWLTSIVFWLLIFFSAAVFVFNLILLTDIKEEFQLRITLPYAIEVVEDGKIMLPSGTETVRIEEAFGKLHLVDTPFYISKIMLRILFVVLLLGLYMAWRFKLLVTNLKNGLFFVKENVLVIKQIAYALLALWITTRIYVEVIYHTLIKHIEFDSIIFTSQRANYDYMIQIALALWIMAHIFGKGIEIKKEQDLTV